MFSDTCRLFDCKCGTHNAVTWSCDLATLMGPALLICMATRFAFAKDFTLRFKSWHFQPPETLQSWEQLEPNKAFVYYFERRCRVNSPLRHWAPRMFTKAEISPCYPLHQEKKISLINCIVLPNWAQFCLCGNSITVSLCWRYVEQEAWLLTLTALYSIHPSIHPLFIATYLAHWVWGASSDPRCDEVSGA